jgi:hypothetical protein
MLNKNLSLKDLNRRIKNLLEYYIEKNECISCSLIDREGFILAQKLKDLYDDNFYITKLAKLAESLTGIDEIDFEKKTRTLSFRNKFELEINSGFVILIREVGNGLYLISVHNLTDFNNKIRENFEQLANEFKYYFIIQDKNLLKNPSNDKISSIKEEKQYNII